MQLMPETDFWLDKDYDGFNPEGNIRKAFRWRSLCSKYKGSE